MRVLFLSHCVPYPPDKGEKIRAFHTLRALSYDHQIDLIAVSRNPADEAHEPELRKYCRAVKIHRLNRISALTRALRSLIRPGTSVSENYFISPDLIRQVEADAIDEGYDLVFAFSSSVANLAGFVQPASGKVLDLIDVDSDKWQQYAQFRSFPMSLIYRIESKRLRNFEKKAAVAFDSVIVCTTAERQLLSDLTPGADPVVVRNGVDLDFFKPSEVSLDSTPRLIFVGQMDYYPNVDAVCFFAAQVFPLIRQQIPSVQFDIVGRSPSRKVLQLQEIQGVNVTGEVPDIRPFIAKAWAFVAPFRIARGVQNKVLEAMAMNRPVLCTSIVSEGISDGRFLPGRDLLVADSISDLSESALELLNDPRLRGALAQNAMRKLRSEFSWGKNMQVLRDLILGLEKERPLADAE